MIGDNFSSFFDHMQTSLSEWVFLWFIVREAAMSQDHAPTFGLLSRWLQLSCICIAAQLAWSILLSVTVTIVLPMQ